MTLRTFIETTVGLAVWFVAVSVLTLLVGLPLFLCVAAVHFILKWW